jgi:hypothetical protein
MGVTHYDLSNWTIIIIILHILWISYDYPSMHAGLMTSEIYNIGVTEKLPEIGGTSLMIR